MRDYIRDGAEIYRRSFATIRSEADLARFDDETTGVVVRMIHASGMVDLAADVEHSAGVVQAGRAALQAGAPILCDAQMVAAGITRKRLPATNEIICTLSDPRVPELARSIGDTRSAAALDLWGDRLAGAVVAIGNAPTALFHLLDLLDEGAAQTCCDSRSAGRLHRRGRVEGGTGRVRPSVPGRARTSRRQCAGRVGRQRDRE